MELGRGSLEKEIEMKKLKGILFTAQEIFKLLFSMIDVLSRL
jgi:hypothetical protein